VFAEAIAVTRLVDEHPTGTVAAAAELTQAPVQPATTSPQIRAVGHDRRVPITRRAYSQTYVPGCIYVLREPC
jgi:hypothetical protein